MYRPYALTSRLHNNDAMLGVKTCRAARTCFAGRAHWRFGAHPLSQCAHPGQLGGEACRGLPSECMLGDGARGVPRLTPNTTGAPFCDVICIWSISILIIHISPVLAQVTLDRTLSYRQHIEQVEGKVRTRNNLLHKLTNS